MANSSKEKTGDSSGGNRRWITALFLTVVVIAISAYFLLPPRDYSNDPQVVEIREIQEEARKRYLSNGGPSTEAEARAFVQSMEQVRKKWKVCLPMRAVNSIVGEAMFSIPPCVNE